MAFTTYFLCIALLCGVQGSPLGQLGQLGQLGSIYDYSPMPGGVPNIGSTTVCETTPSLVGLGLGYPCPVNCPVNYGYLPYQYSRYQMPYPINDNIGYYPYQNYQGATTTVCETTPNVVGILPYPNVQVPNVQGTTTICETTPNVLPVNPYINPCINSCFNPCINPMPYPGLMPGYSPYGMPFL